MFKVSEIAKRCGVSADTVRHYTQIGLLRPRRDPRNRYHLYSVSDIKRLRFIFQAKRLGYTLNEIGEIMRDARQGRSPCPRVREIIAARIDENRRRVDELSALQHRMEHALANWGSLPDGVPDGDLVCHLIESVGEADRDIGA